MQATAENQLTMIIIIVKMSRLWYVEADQREKKLFYTLFAHAEKTKIIKRQIIVKRKITIDSSKDEVVRRNQQWLEQREKNEKTNETLTFAATDEMRMTIENA